VTRRRQLEEGLAAARRAQRDAEARAAAVTAAVTRSRQALDTVPQAVLVADASGAIVLRNRAAEAYADARHGDALVERASGEELRATLSGTPRRRELDLFGPPARSLVITTTPLPDGGAVAVIEDVSERRRVDAVRRDFVANVSHELKTPVGALSVLAEAMEGEQEPAVLRRLAARLGGEVDRLSHLIDDLLELSRIEVGADPEREDLSAADLVAAAVERVTPLASTRHIALDTAEVDASHGVQGDARQIVAALTNLLENAIVYSDETSTVFVRTRADDGAFVSFDIEDRGIGIPTRDLDRVFERFYRVDPARSRATGGTGLGLAIVRHVATNHGGEVSVQSAEGIGSTFTLRLPGEVRP